jgi:hypothetical protein
MEREMKLVRWQFILGVVLVVISALVYYIQFLIFGRTGETFFYLLQDLAFLPVQVLLVTLILNQLFKRREKLALQHKMNMVVGAFFSEVGTSLLKSIPSFDRHQGEINGVLMLCADWSSRDFENAKNAIQRHDFAMDAVCGDLAGLKEFLTIKRAFLLGLLENPNLIEHESFTELLWAVFHLTEELCHRHSLLQIPEADREHLSNDIKRAYALLIFEWLSYNSHLQADYPYMFSLVIRTNPFNPDAKVELG